MVDRCPDGPADPRQISHGQDQYQGALELQSMLHGIQDLQMEQRVSVNKYQPVLIENQAQVSQLAGVGGAPAAANPSFQGEGWCQYTDEQGREYWYNHTTQESSWSRPVGMGLAEAPPAFASPPVFMQQQQAQPPGTPTALPAQSAMEPQFEDPSLPVDLKDLNEDYAMLFLTVSYHATVPV